MHTYNPITSLTLVVDLQRFVEFAIAYKVFALINIYGLNDLH